MKIVITKETTCFYTEKKNKKVLDSAIKSIKKLKYHAIVFQKNRFILKHKVNPYEIKEIMSYFEKEEQKKIDLRTVVTGFTGCLVTGHQLEWI